MSNNIDEATKRKWAIQRRLDRIWEDETELRIQRKDIEDELQDEVLGTEETNWLKARHFALGKALDALKNQKNVIEKISDSSKAINKKELSDTAFVIKELKKKDATLAHKLDKLSAFLTDDNQTDNVSERLIELLKCQEDMLFEYHYILMNHIFDLQERLQKSINILRKSIDSYILR